MEKSTKASLLKIRSSLLLFFLLCLPHPSFASVYFDQISVEMPNAVKTVYDIRVHSFFRNLYVHKVVTNPMTDEWMKKSYENELQSFIEQLLVTGYALDSDQTLKPTSEDAMNAQAEILKVFKNMDEKKKSFAIIGIDDSDLHDWIINRLTLQKFLDNTIQNRVVITDQKIHDHYQTYKQERFFNHNFSDVELKVKEDLSSMLLDEEFQKWVDQEKRRRKLIVKTLQSQ